MFDRAANAKRYKAENTAKISAYQAAYYQRNRHRHSMVIAMCHARKRAAKLNLPFDLDKDYMMSLGTACALSGIEFRSPNRHVGMYSPSTDRIKPELGYVKGNVRLILHCLNAMKGVESDYEMFSIMRLVLERNDHVRPGV